MEAEKLRPDRPGAGSGTSEAQPSTVLNYFEGFLKGFSFLGSAYALGYFGFSPSWVMLAVAVWILRDKVNREKKYKLAVGRESVMREKEVVLARLDELPSWVFFPDVERAEWLNKILHKLWPYVGDYTRDLIRTSIEPSIRSSLPSYLSGFTFETINLGNIPLRVGGVKVYTENVARGELVMDMEIFYAGDCDFVMKVKNLRAGIKDLQIHGTIRVIMKPLVKQMPLVGGLNVFFLTNPDIDFNLTNIADILDMPGLSDTLRRVITEQIAAYMVLPNKLPIPLIADLPSKILKFNPPAGILQIHVIEARELRKADISLTGKGKSDPFSVITVGAQSFKSQVIDNTVEPYWNFSCEAIVDQISGQNIDIDIYDEDPGKSNDFLGGVFMDIGQLAGKGIYESWVPLESTKTGEIHVKTVWKCLTDSIEDLKMTKQEFEAGGVHSLSSALLLVYIDSAKNLPLKAKTLVEPNPKVKLTVGSKTFSTTPKYNTQNPVWEECFYILLSDPEIQSLFVEIHQQEDEEKCLGHYKFQISRLVEDGATELDQNFRLDDSGPDSEINMTLKLKFFGQAQAIESAPGSPKSSGSETATERPLLETTSDQGSNPSVNEAVSDNANASPNEDIIRPVEATSVMSMPPSSSLRHRVPTPTEGKFGRIQITLRYSDNRNKFIVVVHKALNLVPDACDDEPDPYVKLYLLPDKSKDSKRKTDAHKNSVNPVFDESFEFMVNHSELSKHSLHVSVNSKSSTGVFSKKTSLLGQILIPLDSIDLNKASTEWYNLKRSNE